MIIFLGIRGDFPKTANKILSRITRTEEKATTWTAMIHRIPSAGFISRAELESAIVRLSFTRTSVFVRIGRGIMAPLYAKLRAYPYHPVLYDRETATLERRADALPNMEPRVSTPKADRVGRIVYAGASGRSQIIAAVILGPSSFKDTKYIRSITHTDWRAVGKDLRFHQLHIWH